MVLCRPRRQTHARRNCLGLISRALVASLILLAIPGCDSTRPARPLPTDAETPSAFAAAEPGTDGGSHRPAKIADKKNTAASDAPAVVPVALPDDATLQPSSDGWDSEHFSAQASDQLSALAKLIQSRQLTAESAASVVADGCRVYPLPTAAAERRLADGTIVVRDFTAPVSVRAEPIDRGASGFANTLGQLLEPWQGPLARVKFKLVGATEEGETWETRQLVSFAGKTPGGLTELHATWIAEWTIGATQQRPRITAVRFLDARQTTSQSENAWFADATRSLVGNSPWYADQAAHGVDYWQQRLELILTGQFGHHGLAIGDVNGDGLDDVYLCQPGGLPNLLLVQQPDGTVRNESRAAGVDFLDLSRSALLIDLDNDGDQDLVLATANRLVLLKNVGAKNDGPTKFRQMVELDSVSDANSLSAADFDLDGDLDLYVCVYSGDGGKSRGSPTPVPIHDAQNGGANALFRNDSLAGDGAWEFKNVTDETGLDADNHRWSYAAAWEDFDADGDPDLYVANDFGKNHLYRNESGRFVEYSLDAGIDQSAFGMSVSWGDFNCDGHMDVYVGNMFSGAGSRITEQSSFQPQATDEIRRQLRYAARGNTLYENQGDGTFQDVSVRANVMMGRWAWGSLFADLNNDGWEDLLVGNGFVTRENAPDL